MKRWIITTAGGSAVIAVTALGAASPTLAASHSRAHKHRNGSASSSSSSRETPLTGSALTSAENAAVTANPGSTANGASTEPESSLSGAAYEVSITKADGSKAVVIEDSNFSVLATRPAMAAAPQATRSHQ